MRLLREVTENIPQPVTPEDGWNVGHLAHQGIMLSCDGFSIKLDLDQLNVLFDFAESGDSGEIRDHDGEVVYVEVNDRTIVLSRDDDTSYPNGVVLDMPTLKEMGIEKHEAAEQEEAGNPSTEPAEEPPKDAKGDTIIPKAGETPPDEPKENTDDITEEAEPEEDEEPKAKDKPKGVDKPKIPVNPTGGPKKHEKKSTGFHITSEWRKGGKKTKEVEPKVDLSVPADIKHEKIVRILKGGTARKERTNVLPSQNKSDT